MPSWGEGLYVRFHFCLSDVNHEIVGLHGGSVHPYSRSFFLYQRYTVHERGFFFVFQVNFCFVEYLAVPTVPEAFLHYQLQPFCFLCQYFLKLC